MAFQFRMIISGLCAVVPDTPFEETIERAGSVTLLLPNLLRARRLQNLGLDGQNEVLDAHEPVLQFDPAARQPGSTRELDRPEGLCSLRGEEIEILPVPGLVTSFEVVAGRPISRRAAQPQDESSLYWLTTTDQALGHSRLKPGLLDGELGIEKSYPIVARVKVARGRLKTERLSDRACRFQPALTQRFNRRVAVSLAIEIDNVPRFVSLSMKKSGEAPKTLFLAPPAGQNELVVHLQNLEADQVIGLDHVPQRALADYEVYYDLLEDFDEHSPRPFLQPLLTDSEVPDTTAHALCPPTGVHG